MFKFNPLLKSILWGGEKIVPFKHLTSDQKQVGESWEISGVKDNESVVSNGEYKGWTLNKLVETLKDKLVVRRTMSALAMSFLCLLSSLMHASSFLFRFIQRMSRHKHRVWVVVRQRCGM